MTNDLQSDYNTSMTVSVVIPTFNVVELLKKNLPHVIDALVTYDSDKVELIVTDNNSSDESIAFLKELQKKTSIPFTVLDNDYNGGFAVNVNRGVKVAKNDIVILLGTDVIPDKNFIQPLLKHFQNDKIFAVGSVNKSDEDEDSSTLRGRGEGEWKKGFLLHTYGELKNDKTLWVDCGSGAFRRSYWNKIGGLQELYAPYYWEDVDLSYRAQKIGYQVKIEKESRVVHEHKKGSIKKTSSSNHVLQTTFRNQFFFVWLNITDKDLLKNHFLFLPYHLLTMLKNRNMNFFRGFIAALFKLPFVLNERRKIVKRFTVTDKEILSQFKI